MKAKNLLVMLGAPVLFSFIAASTIELTDIQKEGLKGKVKSVSTVEYEMVVRFDEYVKGGRYDSTVQQFNDKGYETSFFYYEFDKTTPAYDKQKQFNTAGKLTKVNTHNTRGYDKSVEYVYDGSGKLTETNERNESGTLKEKIKYKYNSKGLISQVTKYDTDGERTAREYRYYNAAGQHVISSHVDPRGNLQEQVAYVFDAQGRITRELHYDGTLQLLKYTDYFFDGNRPDNTVVRFRNYPIQQSAGTPIIIDENGQYSKGSYVYSYDANGLLKTAFIDATNGKFTYDYQNGVLRLITAKYTDGGVMTTTYNEFGDLTLKEMTTASGEKGSMTYTWNADRLLTEVYNSSNLVRLKLSHDEHGRMSELKTYQKEQLNYTQVISFNYRGDMESSTTKYPDPAQKEYVEKYEMTDNMFRYYPTWWMEGMMHTTRQIRWKYDAKGQLIEQNTYYLDKKEDFTYEYKLDANGNWIFRKEIRKESGRPVKVYERKITYH